MQRTVEVHQMMLRNQDYQESIKNIIRTQEVNAEYAVASTGDNFSKCLQAWTMVPSRASSRYQGYFRAAYENLSGQDNPDMEFEEPVIVVADNYPQAKSRYKWTKKKFSRL